MVGSERQAVRPRPEAWGGGGEEGGGDRPIP